MPCFRPLKAWQTASGDILFSPKGTCGKGRVKYKPPDMRRELELPCGQCVGCRLERSRRWAMRCVHESQCHEFSSFVTLTYREEDCPVSLDYSHFQKFMKRVRKRFGPTRFFMAGEYGETNFRPHYHALLFGVHFDDRVLFSRRGGLPLYESSTLNALWAHGFATVGDVTFESAAYTARYCMKKVTGDGAESHYRRVDARTGEIFSVVPEFAHMSLKPGVGAPWFERYSRDVFNRHNDSVIVNGVKCSPPRYYRQYLDKLDWDLGEDVDLRRYLRADQGQDDRTPERLAVREKVANARLAFYKRDVE